MAASSCSSRPSSTGSPATSMLFEQEPLEGLAADGRARGLPASRVLAADGRAARPSRRSSPCGTRATHHGLCGPRSDIGRRRGATSTDDRASLARSAVVERELLYQQRFEDFAAGSITDAYDVVACRTCGMCFASAFRRRSVLGVLRAVLQVRPERRRGRSVRVRRRALSRTRREFIAAHVADRDSPVLDIGTATGRPPRGAARPRLQRAFTASSHRPRRPATRARRHGLDVIAGDARRQRRHGPSSFAVVSLVAVLEHLVDPAAALQRDHRTAAIRTAPCTCWSPTRRRFSDHVDAPYQEFSVEHINYFTPASLRNLLASVGLEWSSSASRSST